MKIHWNSATSNFCLFFTGTGSEEVSVFNGDENHKVWAGKTPEPPAEGIYDYGSTLRSFRSTVSGTSHRNRPRQMLMPSSPPPPPIPEEKEEAHSPKKDKKKKKRSKSRDNLDSSAPPGMVYMGNGSVMNGRKHSSSGSLMGLPRSMMNGHGPPRGNGVPPPMKSGTFTGRGKKNKNQGHPPPQAMMMYGPPPPHLMPPPGHPLYGMPPYAQPMFGGPPPPNGNGPHNGRPNSRVMEEPIYMPHNARPMSPVASYQPGHFPHEAYYNQQQYATIDKANKHGNHGPRKSKKKDKSTPLISSDSNAEDSEFGAGIYKKGHINERAFSYSIRNEHRSRSYGSLADYEQDQDGAPIDQNGVEHHEDHELSNEDSPPKKEFLHMMSELELGDDTIERREVPPGLYPPPHAQMGGRTPPHMMMVGEPRNKR